MSKVARFLAATVLVAACGRSIATSSSSQSQLAPPDAFKCVLAQFEAQGFTRLSYDKDALRTSAQKVNPKIHLSNVQFRKGYDRLEVLVKSGASGATELEITPSTVAEYFGQTGPAYNQLETGTEAKQAAQTIATKCGGNVVPTASPSPS